MNNRCQECNRFVPLDVENGVAVMSVEDSVVSGSVRISLVCGDCGAVMGNNIIEFECRTSDFEEV